MPAIHFPRLARQLASVAAIAAALGAAQAASAAVFPGDQNLGGISAARVADRDVFTDGARIGERSAFTDGAHNGARDAFTEGARSGSRDVFTDGARDDGAGSTVARISNRDGYTESEHAPGSVGAQAIA
ncbi:copper resistance protein CopQ [Cupriavidus necator]|uniref:copper resistance protein CopQ n=1 Tax=Cupriavidus necator TaxID=106590 RepID=UPI00339D4EC1